MKRNKTARYFQFVGNAVNIGTEIGKGSEDGGVKGTVCIIGTTTSERSEGGDM